MPWVRRVGCRARRRAQRHRVHGVEPERRQREGVHRLARVLRRGLVADRALVRRSRRPSRRSHPRAHRLPDRARATRIIPPAFSSGPAVATAVLVRRPRTLLRWRLLASRGARARARAHAVRVRADPRRAPSRAERGRADGVQRSHRGRLHLLRDDGAPTDGERESRAVRQAESARSARRPSPRRSGCGGCTSSGSGCAIRAAPRAAMQARARRAVPRARHRWRRRALATRSRLVLVLRAARVHGHVRARLLHELQVRRVAGSRARGRGARGARPRLLLPLELLGLERVGGARARRASGALVAERTGRARAMGGDRTVLAVRRCCRSSATGAQASRAGEWATREWARDVLNSVEPYGILITGGDNDTFPLWYAQEVEGVRRDVTVAVTSLLNTDWYARGLMRRPIHRYDEAAGPAVYRGRSWPMPTRPLMSLSRAQLDAIPDYVELREPQLFEQGGIRAVIDPRRLEFGVPLRSDILVLQMLKDNLGVRPFYVSRTTAGVCAVARARSVRARAGARDEGVDGSGRRRSRHGRGARAGLPRRAAHDGAVARLRCARRDHPSGRLGRSAVRGYPGAVHLDRPGARAGRGDAGSRRPTPRSCAAEGIDVAEAAHITEWFLGPATSDAAAGDGERRAKRNGASRQAIVRSGTPWRDAWGAENTKPLARGVGPGAREVL